MSLNLYNEETPKSIETTRSRGSETHAQVKQLLNLRLMSRNNHLTFINGTKSFLACKIHFLDRNKVTDLWIPIQSKVPAAGIYPVDMFATNNHDGNINNSAYLLSICYTQECS